MWKSKQINRNIIGIGSRNDINLIPQTNSAAQEKKIKINKMMPEQTDRILF